MSKDIEFHASVVFANVEDDAFVVGFADNEQEPDRYIILQRALERESEEEDDELDNYFLEICGPQYSGYGGVKDVLLRDDAIEILLSTTNRYSGGTHRIHITFSRSAIDFGALRKYLALIFKDIDCCFRIASDGG